MYSRLDKVVSADNKVNIQVIAGNLKNAIGKISTQTPVNAFMISVENEGEIFIDVPREHQSLLYLISSFRKNIPFAIES